MKRSLAVGIWWPFHNAAIYWVAIALLCSLHYLPATSVLQLHRAAQHLGSWSSVSKSDALSSAALPVYVQYSVYCLDSIIIFYFFAYRIPRASNQCDHKYA